MYCKREPSNSLYAAMVGYIAGTAKLVLGMLLCGINLLAHAETVRPNEKGLGYALIFIEGAKLGHKVVYKRYTKSLNGEDREYVITPTDIERGYFLLPLKAKRYQITEVLVPLYNLPYRYDTSERINWRFHVKQGRTSYVGLLRIAKERGVDSVNISMNNRLATDYARIQALIAGEFKHFPLISGGGIRDDYLQELGSGGKL